MNITHAFTRWLEILDQERIIRKEEAQDMYGKNTTSSVRVIEGALRPRTTEEIQKILKVARDERVPLFPISTGHNWGYGTALPSGENNVILDLSLMNRILGFDEKLGVVTVEPGVTLQMLYEYIQKHNLPYLVPLTGAGLKGSLIGNALERGFGVTPTADHFSAITTITAVFADGTMYNSALEEAGCPRIDQLYRYGVGPYLDGIFTQSNVGIVTKMTIALAREPARTDVFFFSLKTHKDLQQVTDKLHTLLSTLGSTTTTKFINKHQILAMNGLTEKTSPHKAPEWTVTGGLFGDEYMVAAAKKIIKRELRSHTSFIFFLNAHLFKKYYKNIIKIPLPLSIKHGFHMLSLTVDLFLGKPSTVALPLAYLGSGVFPKKETDADPGKDGAGLTWFAPLLPMEGKIVTEYISLVEKVLTKYNLPKLITFTSLNDRCFDSPVPLVFDKQNKESVENAKQCFNELWNECKKLGLMPYRIPIDEQWRVTESGTPFWDIAEKIKDALDPHNIISPKRYSKK